ncbi:MAG: Ig-like domain-containing protein [Gammaproteobacteria bacterium]|nr:Ig-like domain-containing protein [Gammaproteobacteria bacterium]
MLFSTFIIPAIISLMLPGCFFESSSGTFVQSAVIAVSPPGSSDTALVSTEITASFRDDINAATLDSAFFLTLNGTPVATTLSYEATTKTATLTPAPDLLPGTEYRATIDSSIEDVTGNTPLSSDYVWSFTTSPAMMLVSKNEDGVSGNDLSSNADIDSTGRYIVFESEAGNLTSVATTFNRLHAYRKDTVSGEVILVSSDESGMVEANNAASNPRLSANGRYVVFESSATNLVTDITLSPNGPTQIFLKNLDDHSITLVSRGADMSPDNSVTGSRNARISDDGQYIVFQSSDPNLSAIDGGGVVQIYRKDMNDESVEMISRSAAGVAGNAASTHPEISADGRYIVFESMATNFTASNGFRNIYYVDTNATTHAVELISLTTTDTEATADSHMPSVSDDGTTVAFHTIAMLDATLDTNGADDVYLRDRLLPSTQLISVNPNTTNSGNAASNNASIRGNGDYIAFESLASDLVVNDVLGIRDIFVRDYSNTDEIIIDRINLPATGDLVTAGAYHPVISSDGRYVSFHSVFSFTNDDADILNDVFRAHNNTHP